MTGWLIDLVPWWLWALLGVIALAASWQWWWPLWAALPRWLKEALVAIATGILIYLAGRNRGTANERARQKAADAQAIKRRKEIDDEVARLPPADRDRRLDRWMRD